MAYIGLLLIAVSLLIMAVYVSLLMTKSSKLLLTTTHAVKDIETELDQSFVQLQVLLDETEELAADAEGKLQAAAPAFTAIENIGRSSRYMSEIAAKRTKQFEEDGTLPGTAPFIKAIQYGEFGSKVLESWERGKKSAAKS